MRGPLFLLIVTLIACGPDAPQRLLVGRGDTLVINFETTVRIPIHGLDREGRNVAVDSARFVRIEGAPISITADGHVTCDEQGDARVRASAGALTTEFLLRCRPVHSVFLLRGPLQFVATDSARFVLSADPQPIEVVAQDKHGASVDLIAPTTFTLDSSVVRIEGLSVRPLRVGTSLVCVRLGYRDGCLGIKVYERVMSPETIRPDQRVAAVPIELGAGEMRRWTLGPGNYSLTMVPYADSIGGLRLRIERANCVKEPFPRRYGCFTPDSMIVTIWHPGSAVHGARLRGELLVQRN